MLIRSIAHDVLVNIHHFTCNHYQQIHFINYKQNMSHIKFEMNVLIKPIRFEGNMQFFKQKN